MRIILILVVLGGLILLLAYNLSPVSLVFLSMRSPALPLAVWILLSLAAGAITSLFINGLHGLSNYFANSSSKRRNNNIKSPPPRPSEQRRETDYTTTYTAPNTPKPNTESASSDEFDDWGSNSNNDDWDTDDWESEEDTDKEDTNKTRNSNPQIDIKDSRTYEVNQEPQSSNKSGAVYSYSYQEPKNSGVGKTESVYDADYRVLTPPYRQIDTTPEDEDWGFNEDDDFFEDEGGKNSPTKEGEDWETK